MKHVIALIIKFIMIAAVLEIILSMLTNFNFVRILYISLIVTLSAYIVGDLLILSATNNTIATIADVGLAAFVLYMFNFFWIPRQISLLDALICAAVIGIGEWFFHHYIKNNVFPNQKEHAN
ncbi:MAG: DUF2512 family protein [Clostridium lundense]|nr:DUF2512 family protein [Clostridium lundense]